MKTGGRNRTLLSIVLSHLIIWPLRFHTENLINLWLVFKGPNCIPNKTSGISKLLKFSKAINLNNFLTLGQNPRWLSAPCEHSERRPPVFVWSHHSLLLYRSLKIQTEQVCNYLVVIFQIIMNLMHTCRYMYWQQTEWNIGPTLRHLMFHDLQILEEMEYIVYA